jgi:hypothetical protein
MKIHPSVLILCLGMFLWGCIPAATSPVPSEPSPIPPQPTAAPISIPLHGLLTFSTGMGQDEGIFLFAGETITVNWDGAPAGAERYDFILSPNDGSPSVVVGTDHDSADGVSVLWTVPGHLDAELNGRAYFADGSEAGSGGSGGVISGDVKYGGIRFPYVTGDAGNFALELGAQITLNWEGAPEGADLYEFILYPQDGSSPVVIGTDHNPADGVSITWTVPRGVAAELKGIASFSDGHTAESNVSGTLYSPQQ